MQRRLAAILAGAVAMATAPAHGHAGFLLPILDRSESSGEVILTASFSDRFPQPEIALHSDAWSIITPFGTRTTYDAIASDEAKSVLRARLGDTGTYRLSSGERLGRKGLATRIGGRLVRVGRDGMAQDELNADAELFTAQTATVADVYLARGAAGAGFPDTRIARLAIRPGDNPARLGTGESLSMRILFDDEPLAGKSVTVFTPGGTRKEGLPETSRMTDHSGRLVLTPAKPGAHLVMVRHLAMAPAGAQTDVRSYTTTLTVIVAE